MKMMIDLDGHVPGDRYRVRLGEDNLNDSILMIDDIEVLIKRGPLRGPEYVKLQDFIKYVYVAKGLKDSLQSLLQIESSERKI